MKTISWVALLLAIFANVIANLSFKFAHGGIAKAGTFETYVKQPWSWIGLLSALVLLFFYIVAIREIGLGVSYAAVTSLSLVIITVVASVALEERISLLSIVGMIFVIVGVGILIRAELT